MVESTFYGFEASRSALFANQKALDIVGNNLANANIQMDTRLPTFKQRPPTIPQRTTALRPAPSAPLARASRRLASPRFGTLSLTSPTATKTPS